jgi:predicted DNA-binding protein (UPF0278 family)
VDFLFVVAAVLQITWIQVQADMPQLVLVKELMTVLVANEETFGECGESLIIYCSYNCMFVDTGYYMATLEAAVHHISDLAKQYQRALRSGIADSVNQFEDDEDDDDPNDTDSNDD